METDIHRSREAGFSEHLIKPVDPEELAGILKNAARSLAEPSEETALCARPRTKRKMAHAAAVPGADAFIAAG